MSIDKNILIYYRKQTKKIGTNNRKQIKLHPKREKIKKTTWETLEKSMKPEWTIIPKPSNEEVAEDYY